ncbi:SgcJ/EcaC family oxidoreductase [Delftia sp. PS-11]|uniref:SgcJ/EcaC family oxidoreductase n=1 Tax=Delftia sp. PS-11 TaxID=2767222 RepID=UPI00245443E8|nr:SgcJ/EcaC family oxidoreductase [Delftia sp. PS-11]KAJ8741687.1 SgcJ/EcaC family oxidoreductase [Delftia sp. PS-11]
MKAIALLLPAVLTVCAAQAQDIACRKTDNAEIARLFEQWNDALKTRQADKVVALYAQDSLLLPTLSNTPRQTPEAKLDYFQHFLAKQPVGRIDSQVIRIGCNDAMASGLYTFRFGDGSMAAARYTFTYGWDGQRWLITSHHSSAMPER